MRNNRRKKIMGGLLCILLASCTAEEKKEIRPEEPHEETAVVIDGSHAVPPKSKEERITVHTDASGKVLKQSAEYTIKADGTEVIRDTTFLKDLINTSGDEEFMTEDDTHVLFENFGKEITVSGTCDEPVPVSVQITYMLDGKEIRPEDLAGKSGHAVIRFAYENHTDIPFVILTAVPLSASHFSNISGTNARIVSMGDTVFAAGIVLPGWADRLHPEKIKEDLELAELNGVDRNNYLDGGYKGGEAAHQEGDVNPFQAIGGKAHNALRAAHLNNIEFTITNVSTLSVLSDAGTLEEFQPGEMVTVIKTYYNDEVGAYIAETKDKALPYGTYTIQETKTNNAYLLTDGTPRTFEIETDGEIATTDKQTHHKSVEGERLIFRNQIKRGEFEFVKIQGYTTERIQSLWVLENATSNVLNGFPKIFLIEVFNMIFMIYLH